MPSLRIVQGAAIREGLVMARSQPRLVLRIAVLFLSQVFKASPSLPKILVGTHHKVLTVYMRRVFSVFAFASRRTISVGSADEVDYAADILLDHHSKFDFSKINEPWVGVHICRDPRDVVVSCAHYHSTSDESWLHWPRADLAGKTYQEYSRELPTLEDRLLFEIDFSSGYTIRRMLKWSYDRKGMTEWRYEDLVRREGLEQAAKDIGEWPLSPPELRVLIDLFTYFSLWGPVFRNNKHIRDPRPSQWKDHFSDLVHEKFRTVFPQALKKLGYDSLKVRRDG